jgi:putative intracellular protease/amidase
MKNILCFLYDGYADFETVLVCSPLNEDEKYRIIYIAYDTKPVKSSGGLTIIPEKTVSDISSTDNIYGLIIPGGGGRIFKPELGELINRLNDENKLVAAICAGPEYLAKSGILNRKKYTTSQESQNYEERNEPDPFPRETFLSDARVVKDGNIITAKGFAFSDFALEIWEWFDIYETNTEKEELKVAFTPI